MSLMFNIPGPMRGKGRPRFVRATGRAYTPDTTTNAEAWVKQCAVAAGAKPLAGALQLTIGLFVDIPASWSKAKRAAAICGTTRPTSKPDLDNVIKLIGDALNGIAWEDDRQIARVVAEKFYATDAWTTVSVEVLA